MKILNRLKTTVNINVSSVMAIYLIVLFTFSIFRFNYICF